MTDEECPVTDREKELEAQVEALQQQMVAMDRILSGRTSVSNSLAAESGLLLAPFLHIQGLYDSGTPHFAPDEARFRIETEFNDGRGRMETFRYETNRRQVQGLSVNSRLIVVIVNPK